MKEIANKILDKMNNIKYGFVDKDRNVYLDDNSEWSSIFSSKYYLKDPVFLIEDKYGVCWDQVELERYYFNNNGIEVKTYFIISYDNRTYPTHTFLTYREENKFVWFEHSWKKYKGIHKYNTEYELLDDVKNKYKEFLINNHMENDDVIIYEYSKPNYNMDVLEFMKHCENGLKLDI